VVAYLIICCLAGEIPHKSSDLKTTKRQKPSTTSQGYLGGTSLLKPLDVLPINKVTFYYQQDFQSLAPMLSL